MYPKTLREAKKLFNGIARRVSRTRGATIVVCPPLPYLEELKRTYRGTKIRFGAQDVSLHEKEGAHTGEVSASMLKNLGAQYAIVGHSERRAMGETDDIVAAKVRAALKAGLVPLICIGERERDREGKYFSWLERELAASLGAVSRAHARRLVIAYEPIWAIGKTARGAMKPQEVHEMIIFIKKVLSKHYGRKLGMRVPILYGGSVEPGNVLGLMRDGAADGFLVGHASIAPRDFAAIVTGEGI